MNQLWDDVAKVMEQYEGGKFDLSFVTRSRDEFLLNAMYYNSFLLSEELQFIPFLNEEGRAIQFSLEELPRYILLHSNTLVSDTNSYVLGKIQLIDFLEEKIYIQLIYSITIKDAQEYILALLQQKTLKDPIISKDKDLLLKFFFHYVSYYYASLYEKVPH